MAYDYGFGALENELIEVFGSLSPDFAKAKELLLAGADINAFGKDPEENILSESINEYLFCSKWNMDDDYQSTEKDASRIGFTLCDIIIFFLANGFDVNKENGCFGAQCLYTLVLSTFDRYMIKATKILLNAGAKNRTISYKADEDETPWEHVGSEGSFQDTCEGNHALGNLYEALYQIYEAVDKGNPYDGIDSYECAIGKKIIKILASPNKDNPSVFYSMNLPAFTKENCFTSDLYFVYDGGVLRTTKFADFWTDSILPQVELVDVSKYFQSIIDKTIINFSFSNRCVRKESTTYTQPITEIEMEDGQIIKFSINFGDVENENRVAFFELN